MPEHPLNISEAELEILKALWEQGAPMSAKELSAALTHKRWKYSTIATLCARMVEKGALIYEQRGRFYYYTPTVGERAYRDSQTRRLVSRLYGGSVKNLVAALFENQALSEEDIDDLKARFGL